jgi:adenylate cyclase
MFGETPLRVSSRKGMALLAYLAERGTGVPRETLMALLWPDSGDRHARSSLRQTLTAVRRDLGDAATAIGAQDNHSVALDPAAVDIETAEFGRLAQSDDPADLSRARDLWRGEFLEGIGPVTPEFDRWAEAERGALRAAFESVLLRLCDFHAGAGRTDEVIATALRLLTLDPLQEHVHRRVIEAYRQQRRFDAALRQFETLRGVLQGELGVQPEPATLELVREVRRQRGTTAGRARDPEPAPGDVTVASPSLRPSIAVLPFATAPNAPDAALIGEGIAEEVIVNLSRDRALLVVSRQSSFHPDITAASPDEIGARLGVRYLLSGSVRAAGNRIRVVASLARCDDASEIWAEIYDRDIGDIFAVQSDIARTVMATAVGRITDEEAGHRAPSPIGNLDAWRMVLVGLRHLHAHTAEGMRGAVESLARAVALAPENGRAIGLLVLARIYQRWNYASQTEVSDLLPLAERALMLDGRDSRAHCAMAVALLLSRDHARAGHHFEAGLAANPNDDLLLIEYGRYLFYVDRPEDALLRIRDAMRLNPLHPEWFWNIQGRCLHLLGRHGEALAAFQRIAAPAFYHFAYMAACHKALGQDAEAEDMRNRLYIANPDFDVARFVAALPHRSAATAARFGLELEWLGR